MFSRYFKKMIEVFLNIRQSSRFSCAMQKFSYWPLLHVLSTWCLVAQVLISILFCKHFQVVLVRNNFYRGTIFLGGQLSRYNFFRIKLFKVIHSNERKISWNFFWITLFNKEKIWWMLSPQNSRLKKFLVTCLFMVFAKYV